LSSVRAGDVDEVDIPARNQFAPVRFKRLIAPVLRESFGARRVARANRDLVTKRLPSDTMDQLNMPVFRPAAGWPKPTGA
jgi:hypothetical protein